LPLWEEGRRPKHRSPKLSDYKNPIGKHHILWAASASKAEHILLRCSPSKIKKGTSIRTRGRKD
jgi:hypothetical protein